MFSLGVCPEFTKSLMPVTKIVLDGIDLTLTQIRIGRALDTDTKSHNAPEGLVIIKTITNKDLKYALCCKY